MKKSLKIIPILLLFACSVFAQDQIQITATGGVKWFAKGGLGTSWLTFPKVFLVDPNNLENVWEVSPAFNNVTFFAGVQGVLPLGKHWVFAPELDYHYLSGEVKIVRLETNAEAKELQSYSRISVPLNFGAVSSDNFWFEFGPVVYFTIADNNGFDEAVSQLTQNATVNSDVPVGLAMRLGAVTRIGKRMYIEAKFDYDLGRKFEFSDGAYDVRIAMQGITIGAGYFFK